jgi:hypothetical protein
MMLNDNNMKVSVNTLNAKGFPGLSVLRCNT